MELVLLSSRYRAEIVTKSSCFLLYRLRVCTPFKITSATKQPNARVHCLSNERRTYAYKLPRGMLILPKHKQATILDRSTGRRRTEPAPRRCRLSYFSTKRWKPCAGTAESVRFCLMKPAALASLRGKLLCKVRPEWNFRHEPLRGYSRSLITASDAVRGHGWYRVSEAGADFALSIRKYDELCDTAASQLMTARSFIEVALRMVADDGRKWIFCGNIERKKLISKSSRFYK